MVLFKCIIGMGGNEANLTGATICYKLDGQTEKIGPFLLLSHDLTSLSKGNPQKPPLERSFLQAHGYFGEPSERKSLNLKTMSSFFMINKAGYCQTAVDQNKNATIQT